MKKMCLDLKRVYICKQPYVFTEQLDNTHAHPSSIARVRNLTSPQRTRFASQRQLPLSFCERKRPTYSILRLVYLSNVIRQSKPFLLSQFLVDQFVTYTATRKCCQNKNDAPHRNHCWSQLYSTGVFAKKTPCRTQTSKI